MQVQVDQEAVPTCRHPAHQRSRFFDQAFTTEAAVGIDCIRIPALDALIAPWADARRNDQIDAAGIGLGMLIQKLQRAMHAAGFVAVYATGHQRGRQCRVPLMADHREQRVVVRRVVQLAVLHYIETLAQALKRGHDIVVVAALALLACAPPGAFGVAPGLAGGADRIEMRGTHHAAPRVSSGRQTANAIGDTALDILASPGRAGLCRLPTVAGKREPVARLPSHVAQPLRPSAPPHTHSSACHWTRAPGSASATRWCSPPAGPAVHSPALRPARPGPRSRPPAHCGG